jgi:hypothetical protein
MKPMAEKSDFAVGVYSVSKNMILLIDGSTATHFE